MTLKMRGARVFIVRKGVCNCDDTPDITLLLFPVFIEYRISFKDTESLMVLGITMDSITCPS